MSGIRVTAVDLESGVTSTVDIQPGDYLIVVVAPCHVAGEQHYANGTTTITLKGRTTPVAIGGMRLVAAASPGGAV